MSLDEQLRAVLIQEAEMLAPPRPDIEAMISGGRARRRHRATRIGLAAAAVVVLIGGGVYGITQLDRGDAGSLPRFADEPTQPSAAAPPPRYRDLDADIPEPGTYRKVVGFDASGAAIEVDLTFQDPGWFSGLQPVISAAEGSAGLGVFEATAVPDRSACTMNVTGNTGFREAATTPDALGRQLAKLPGGEVLKPLTPTTAFGYEARHLRLRIDGAECPPDEEIYLVAEADTGSLGITYSAPWRVVVDLLILDVDGTAIVVGLWHDVHAPSELIDQATGVRDSISFVAGEPAD